MSVSDEKKIHNEEKKIKLLCNSWKDLHSFKLPFP